MRYPYLQSYWDLALAKLGFCIHAICRSVLQPYRFASGGLALQDDIEKSSYIISEYHRGANTRRFK
jgi:hypothetical protein